MDKTIHASDMRFNPVAMYMMAAYAYYVEDDPIMDDWSFDMYAKRILEEYDKWSSHPHCPTRADLEAGTYLGEYPNRVIYALNHYKRHELGW